MKLVFQGLEHWRVKIPRVGKIRVDWRPFAVSSFAGGYGGQEKMKLML
jgi:hypothetical protein